MLRFSERFFWDGKSRFSRKWERVRSKRSVTRTDNASTRCIKNIEVAKDEEGSVPTGRNDTHNIQEW